MNGPENAVEPRVASSRTRSRPRDTRSIGHHCRQIRHDANALATAVQEATDELERHLSEEVQKRPFSTLGVAAGVGYVLGRGLPSRLTGVLLNVATRLAIALAARELSARLSSSPPGFDQDKSF